MPDKLLLKLISFIGFVFLAEIARTLFKAMVRTRNEAEADGFVASPMLGPLGVYIAAYYYNRKKCPTCTKKIKRNTELCPHCGFPVSPA